MFRRSKPQLSPPTPPTYAQILEDLETFEVEKQITERIRTYKPSTPNTDGQQLSPGTTTTNTVSELELAQWWKTFETFQCDIKDLQKMRRQFQLTKADLIEANAEVLEKSTKIKGEIDKALCKVNDA